MFFSKSIRQGLKTNSYLVYTPGNPGSAHRYPNETTPTRNQRPAVLSRRDWSQVFGSIRGPPESPLEDDEFHYFVQVFVSWKIDGALNTGFVFISVIFSCPKLLSNVFLVISFFEHPNF